MLTFRRLLAVIPLLVLVSCAGSSGDSADQETVTTIGEGPSSTTETPTTTTVVSEPPVDEGAVLTLTVDDDGAALLQFPENMTEHGVCFVIDQWDGSSWTVAQFFGSHTAELTFFEADPNTVDCDAAAVIASEVPVEFPDLGTAWIRLCEVSPDRPCSNPVQVGA